VAQHRNLRRHCQQRIDGDGIEDCERVGNGTEISYGATMGDRALTPEVVRDSQFDLRIIPTTEDELIAFHTRPASHATGFP
jgi:hypothetical protein